MIKLIVNGKEVDVIVDTGFNGHLMLSKKIIDEIGLEHIGSSDYSTASGDEKKTDVYKGKVEIGDDEMEISILSTEGEFSLAGVDLFHNYKVIIERHSEVVEVVKTRFDL